MNYEEFVHIIKRDKKFRMQSILSLDTVLLDSTPKTLQTITERYRS